MTFAMLVSSGFWAYPVCLDRVSEVGDGGSGVDFRGKVLEDAKESKQDAQEYLPVEWHGREPPDQDGRRAPQPG